MLEVELPTPESFLKIKETLTRIGIASRKSKILYQSCHLLHKRGRYYITHFKELFALDGKSSTITPEDIARRNFIAVLLESWNMLDIIGPRPAIDKSVLGVTKIISHNEKNEWRLETKYSLGRPKRLF